MNCLIHQTNMRLIALVLFFAFCQIIGIMCVVPDLSVANDGVQLAEDMSHMAGPMDGTSMCLPSALSSPERQLKHATAVDLDQAPLLLSAVTIFGIAPIPTPWFWESLFSIVPISTASSSVLRI